MEDKHLFIEKLEGYLPLGTSEIVANWTFAYNVEFKITKPRSTKLGDFRPEWKGKPARITVNQDLNRFSFLITTVHEFAHLTTWLKYKNRVKPHGQEWKDEFSLMLKPFIFDNIFPSDIDKALESYMENPLASSCTDLHLSKTLKQYDSKKVIHLEEIEEGTKFTIRKKTFVKGKKRRKRYECIEINTRRLYLVSPIAEIEINC